MSSNVSIPTWIKNRIVGFFNAARNVSDILDGTIQDDPSDGPGRTIGPTLAARILRTRNNLPRRRFSNFDEIDNISGVGPNTVQDLVYSLGISADEAFKTSMYSSGTIYPENWPLEYFRYTFEDEASFNAVANDPANLRTFIHTKMAEVCTEKGVNAQNTQAMLDEISSAYMDEFTNSTPEASYALALHFYRFDADNWFSWEGIQQQTQGYFDHNMNSYPWFMELWMFKGFQNRGILSPGLSPNDLPVVVNHAEFAVSFWISELYD